MIFYQKNSETSKEAAISMIPHVSKIAQNVLNFIASRGSMGATEYEVSSLLSLGRPTSSARIRELCLKGKIRKNGETRLTSSGRRAFVWVSYFDEQMNLF